MWTLGLVNLSLVIGQCNFRLTEVSLAINNGELFILMPDVGRLGLL